jgi:hypothetical protein
MLGACRRQLEENPSHPGLLLLAGICRTASPNPQQGPQDMRSAFVVLRRMLPDEQARLAIATNLVAHAQRLIPSRVDVVMQSVLQGDSSPTIVRHFYRQAPTDSETHHRAVMVLVAGVLDALHNRQPL